MIRFYAQIVSHIITIIETAKLESQENRLIENMTERREIHYIRSLTIVRDCVFNAAVRGPTIPSSNEDLPLPPPLLLHFLFLLPFYGDYRKRGPGKR